MNLNPPPLSQGRVLRFATVPHYLASAFALLGVILVFCEASWAQGEAGNDSSLVPPVVRSEGQLLYPKSADGLGIETAVVVSIDIDEKGAVTSVVLVEPSESVQHGADFDRAAEAAAWTLVFSPALDDGAPIAVQITYRFRFIPKELLAPPQLAVAPVIEPAPSMGELSGRVFERGTRMPLPGVVVVVFRGEGDAADGFETETDATGSFHFVNLTEGSWRLHAEPSGHYPIRSAEQVVSGNETVVRYVVERRSYNAYDILVHAPKAQREVTRRSMSAAMAERMPGSLGDVLSVVQNYPGVGRGTIGRTIVRGSAPKDSRTYVAGIDVPNLYHLGGVRSVLPAGFIERVTLYPGNFSESLGRAIGGVVDVEIARLRSPRLRGYIDVTAIDAGLFAEVPVTQDLSFALGARRSYADAVLDVAFGEKLPSYYDGQLLVSYRPKPAHHLETLVFVSKDKQLFRYENPDDIPVEREAFIVGFQRVILKHHYAPSEHAQNSLTIALGRDLTDIEDGTVTYSKGTQFQARNESTVQLGKGLTFFGGFDYLLQRSKTEITTNERTLHVDDGTIVNLTILRNLKEPRLRRHSLAGFSGLTYKPLHSLSISPGLRIDYWSQTSSRLLQPRLQLSQQLAPSWQLRAGIGRFAQSPGLGENTEGYGNTSLLPEAATHYSLALSHKLREHLSLEATGFYKDIEHVVHASDSYEKVGDVIKSLKLEGQGRGRVVGLEVSAKHEVKDGLFGWVSYSISRSERRDTGQDDYYPFAKDQTHIVSLLGSYRLPRNWTISGRYRHVSGNRFTRKLREATFNDETGVVREAVYGDKNAAKLAPFKQFDFRLDKRWVFGQWMLNAYLEIKNATDKSNDDGQEYVVGVDRDDGETPSGLPILPLLGVRGEF